MSNVPALQIPPPPAMPDLPSPPAFRLDGVGISTDKDGRFCLNDLHRAAGGEKRHRPNYWTDLDQTQELIEELRKPLILNDAGIPASDRINNLEPVSTVKGFGQQGTFVVRELVYAYAMWISPAFHLKVIRTFDALAVKSKGPVQTPIRSQNEEAFLLTPLAMKAAEAFGFTGNQAMLSANRSVTKLTGINLLEAMGQTSLIATERDGGQHTLLTPTDIEKRLGLKGKQANVLLTREEFQTAFRNSKNRWVYEPTEKGKPFAVFLDTVKKHTDGTPVRQLKWASSILAAIEPFVTSDDLSR